MRWSGATDAIARCKRVSIGCGHKCRSVPAWPWICGVKPKPKAVNKPSPHSIVHGLDKPGAFTTVSNEAEPLDIQIQPGQTAGEVLRQLGLSGYILSFPNSSQFFANEEPIYASVVDG